MIAAGMESRRLGLSQKNLYVVPNHLTEQWGADFLRLYPNANVLVATKKDFEPSNRKQFCSRIATGDYDAIVIGHSQFERVPLSPERQKAIVERQIDDITLALADARSEDSRSFTVKQMEKTKKTLEAKLQKLNDQTRNRAMRLLREECRHEFWASYEPASDNSGGKPENECWERCYPYSWKSGLYLRFAEERSEVYCNHAVCCGASHVL